MIKHASPSTTVSLVSLLDFDSYLSIVGEPSVGTYDEEFPKSLETATSDFNDTLSGYQPGGVSSAWQEYGIRDDSGLLIGLASFRVMSDKTVKLVKARVGVHMGSAWRGRGHATRALADVLDMLRNNGVGMAEAVIDHDNTPSRKLFVRAGFKQLGTLGGDAWYYLDL